MHIYRTHNCGQLRADDQNKIVKLSGWLHRKRDHGNLIFLDLRDHYGITQCVIENNNEHFGLVESLKNESVITVTGKVVLRSKETVNDKMTTGAVELIINDVILQSAAKMLPIQVNNNEEFPEETRLKYRFLDLRREKLHNNIMLRSNVIASIRQRMITQGFTEFQTPILTSSSPEGARDFLVPSRLNPGMFYALPQAPQQFKQLLMVSGFDRYFQIAPCFRDEDARADRSPGEFYQLDFEMSFVTQDDVFAAIEPVLHGVFTQFSKGKTVSNYPFERITYDDAMLTYGSDKPDLRNPLKIIDMSEFFEVSHFTVFAQAVKNGSIVRAIRVPDVAKTQSRKFFENLNDWGKELGLPGIGYISMLEGQLKGPIVKFLDQNQLDLLIKISNLQEGDAVFFICALPDIAVKSAGQLRTKLGNDLNLIESNIFKFCWIVDFPMFEFDEKLQKVQFSHNPFSMPQGGLHALETQDPLRIKAYQYDIVCNGIELSSGAIRNHLPDVMAKAFEIAGYSQNELEEQFSGMLNAFQYGAPPHGGCAPGIDRIVMLLADEPNLREIIAFPMNQQAQDLLMQAPNNVPVERLKEVHIKLDLPPQLPPKN